MHDPSGGWQDRGGGRERVGSQRILYRSDMTTLNPAHTIGMIMSSEISKEDKERIFYINAKGLFKI